MTKANRELTAREKQRIKKLIVSTCANYDKEYGCLPLDCDCPMFGYLLHQQRTLHLASWCIAAHCAGAASRI